MLRSGRSASGFDSHHPDHGVAQLGPIKYFVKGKSPKLLIRSGSHGDEYEVIEALKLVINAWRERLPDFVFIPEVSPSAVTQRTRLNGRGMDINRLFLEGSRDSEVVANMQIAKGYRFELCLDFHEDTLTEGFYLYDSGSFGEENISRFRERVLDLGVGLFSGVDDPNDPLLAIKIENGYLPNSHEEMDLDSGMFEIWAVNRGLVKRSLVPEIPGKLSLAKKKELVELIFFELVL